MLLWPLARLNLECPWGPLDLLARDENENWCVEARLRKGLQKFEKEQTTDYNYESCESRDQPTHPCARGFLLHTTLESNANT